MDLNFLLEFPLCKRIVTKNPYSTATYLYSTMVYSETHITLQ